MHYREVPVLFTSYNRLEYTRESLSRLIESCCGTILVFDNMSTDGTREWLKTLGSAKLSIHYNEKNEGVAGAMNFFFNATEGCKYIAKVDNDTVVPRDWLTKLLESAEECELDIVQAKHPILRQSHPSGDFDEWMKTLPADKRRPNIRYSDHVGGTAVLIRRSKIDSQLESKWLLGGWDKFQAEHPDLKIAFDSAVEVELLDTRGGRQLQERYERYYEETKRKNLTDKEVIERLDAELRRQGDRVAELQKRLDEALSELEITKSHLNDLHSSDTYRATSFTGRLLALLGLRKAGD